MSNRVGSFSRSTKETTIAAEMCLDGGEVRVETGIGFFDHMLTAFAVHGGFGLTLTASGDLQVDSHHTVEDTGIVLGRAFADALCCGKTADKTGIARFGHFFVPMDESLGFAAADVSGRPYVVYNVRLPEPDTGKDDRKFDPALAPEFFRAFATNAGITLHLRAEYGENIHHILEALFKAAGHALRLAVMPKAGTLSTKGVIDFN